MGKGDQRTGRGKLYRGTYGKWRPHEHKHRQEQIAPKKKSRGTANKERLKEKENNTRAKVEGIEDNESAEREQAQIVSGGTHELSSAADDY